MEASMLYDESFKPDDESLFQIFGETAKHWQAVKKHLKDEFGNYNEEWKFYYKKSGWLLQVTQKKRTLFWLRPFIGYFSITFWFSDKTVAIVEKSDLPEDIINTLKNAKKHQIGRSISIYVKLTEDVENVKKLIGIKINN